MKTWQLEAVDGCDGNYLYLYVRGTLRGSACAGTEPGFEELEACVNEEPLVFLEAYFPAEYDLLQKGEL